MLDDRVHIIYIFIIHCNNIIVYEIEVLDPHAYICTPTRSEQYGPITCKYRCHNSDSPPPFLHGSHQPRRILQVMKFCQYSVNVNANEKK